ncbi:iron ABC transporter permease (plasmid) [Paracoccus versutus]|uniref:Iron(III) transport system permease protein n=1 Tax=Paracoccus versutus TaxID=34007 RepID=A0AAQ0HHI3_PARVE|nr:iron ABC transporter permease [Paracoccus versutus]REG47024.1 iron(III) transport system permease protein [Paracoccus versutus]WEJ82204.1 iron ABC transporter permease [Paracoccus versutus]SFX94255.1 iron(III) transport system permease protein [Paracoccus pantotrophus]
MTPELTRIPRVRAGMGWQAAALAVAALVLLPVLALGLFALRGSPGLWAHLVSNVLPVAARQTVILLLGVGAIVATLGTVTAWLVAACDFPGRRFFGWALLLPLAVPTYIVAYAYLDLLHPVGPVQGAIRGWLGYSSPREFRLPDIRSMPGCILLLGLVLYPYVYLPVRALFAMQAGNLLDAGRSLGAGPVAGFLRVALPLARPAVAIGTALALMEAMNDIGAAEFLGVRTLTVSVYSTWINRSDLPGAAQIALAMLAITMALVMLERRGRRRQRYAAGAQPLRRTRLGGWRAWGATLVCALPVALGFAAPAWYLVGAAWARYRFAGLSPRIIEEAGNTALFAALATLVALVLGLVVTGAARMRPGRLTRSMARLSTLGYAVPGTILAIGLLPVIALADRQIAAVSQALLGAGPGLLLLGSGAALVYAYVARFLAIATGGIEAGLSRVPASLDHAARTLGRSPGQVFRQVHVPISRPALAASGLLIFVDCVKELPATLLLRPLNFETLSTHLYGEAARGTYEDAAIAALIIVVIGILPVMVLARTIRR